MFHSRDMAKARGRGTARSSSKSDLLPIRTMGTLLSSFMRRICSRNSASSQKDDAEVMLNTNRKPWPVFMYSSLWRRKWGNGVCKEAKRDGLPHGSCDEVSMHSHLCDHGNLLNCSVPAVSRISRMTWRPWAGVRRGRHVGWTWRHLHQRQGPFDMSLQW